MNPTAKVFQDVERVADRQTLAKELLFLPREERCRFPSVVTKTSTSTEQQQTSPSLLTKRKWDCHQFLDVVIDQESVRVFCFCCSLYRYASVTQEDGVSSDVANPWVDTGVEVTKKLMNNFNRNMRKHVESQKHSVATRWAESLMIMEGKHHVDIPGTATQKQRVFGMLNTFDGQSVEPFSRPESCPTEEPAGIFLSYRVPDTKQTVATPLHDDLINHGIKCAYDMNVLQLGLSTSESLRNLLFASRLTVALVSERFGESIYCLKEVNTILQREVEEGRRILVPVLYPQALRNPQFAPLLHKGILVQEGESPAELVGRLSARIRRALECPLSGETFDSISSQQRINADFPDAENSIFQVGNGEEGFGKNAGQVTHRGEDFWSTICERYWKLKGENPKLTQKAFLSQHPGLEGIQATFSRRLKKFRADHENFEQQLFRRLEKDEPEVTDLDEIMNTPEMTGLFETDLFDGLEVNNSLVVLPTIGKRSHHGTLDDYVDADNWRRKGLMQIRSCKTLTELCEFAEGGIVNSSLDAIQNAQAGAQSTNEWAKLWAQDLCKETSTDEYENANLLDKYRKVSVEFLYYIANHCYDFSRMAPRIDADVSNIVKKDHVERILRLCLPMDRAKCLFFLHLHWYAQQHSKNISYSNISGHTINRRYQWIIDNLLSATESAQFLCLLEPTQLLESNAPEFAKDEEFEPKLECL